MTPTTCTSCGTPLPEVAADQHQPDRCAACTADAGTLAPPPPPPPPPPPTPRTAAPAGPPVPPPPAPSSAPPAGPPAGPAAGLAWPAAAAPSAGPAWPTTPSPAGFGGPPTGAPAMLTRTRWLEAVIVGLAAATIAGVAWWGVIATTKTQFAYGAIAVGILVGQGVLIGARRGGVGPALVAVLASLGALVVAEYFIQRSLAISQLGADIPLWLGFSSARQVVEDAVRGEPQTGLFWGIAALVAAISAGSRSRRPVI